MERVEGGGLFDFEKLQLTDNVLAKLSEYQLDEQSAISFATLPQHLEVRQSNASRPKCKTYPGDADWPSEASWRLFDVLLGKRLIKTVPEAARCHPEWGQYSADVCQSLTAGWNNSTLRYTPLQSWEICPQSLTRIRIENPTSIRSIIFQGMTCMPTNYTAAFLGNTGTCTIGGFPQYSINVTNVGQVQLAVNIARELNLRLVIKNTGHDFGAKSTGGGALSIWTHYLKESEYYPEYRGASYTGPAFKLGAGIQVKDANKLAKDRGVTLIGGEGIVSA